MERKIDPASEAKPIGIWIRVSTEDQAQGESPKHHEMRALSALVRKFGHVFVRPPVGDLGRPAAGVVWPSPGG